MFAGVRTILFATNLSTEARRVFEYTVSLADGLGAQIVLLHVLEGTSSVVESRLRNIVTEDTVAAIKEKNREAAKDALIGKSRDGRMIHDALHAMCDDEKAARKECRFGIAEIVIAEGNVGDVIVDAAGKNNCDLIVMGHYERGFFELGRLTSAVNHVLKKSGIPVLLVPVKEKE
ncbi:MAG: universal stress protein [Deltaproteobacteria bacterium]|nr:universal stress protein [Deltaproteobacteria bacterium]